MTQADQAYTALFRSHPTPMLIFDVETLDILGVNDAAARVYGYSEDEFLALNIRGITPEEDIPRLEETVANAGHGLQDAGEWRHRLRDGTLIDVAIVTHELRFHDRAARLVHVTDITARKHSEQQLRLLSTGLHAAANAILISDRDGVIEWVNPAFTAMTGYTQAEATGSTPGDLLRSGQHDGRFYRDLWETILRGEVWRGRMVNRRKDGTLYHEEQTVTPVRDPDGQVRHFIAIKEDVTQRLEAEEALRRSEARYRSLFDGVPIGLYRTTPGGRIVDVNTAMVRLLGYRDREQLQEKPVLELYEDPAARDQFLGLLETAGEVYGLDVRLRCADGRVIWARVSSTVERDADGAILYVEGAMQDVTERREDEDRLRFQGQLLGAAGEAVIATDLGGRILYWNHRAEELTGWSSEDVSGRDAVEVLGPEVARAEPDTILQRVRTGATWSGESEIQRREGTVVPTQVTAAPIHDERGRVVGAVAVIRDLSVQRSLEEELRHAQKMEAVGRLAGGIAHDFNNVLTAIQGHTQFLIDGLQDDSRLLEDAHVVQRSAERAKRLTQQLLAFSRKQILKATVLDVRVVLQELEELIRPLIGEDVILSISTEEHAAYVEVDPGQFEQVLLNLVVNARDAMPAGGELHISTQPTDHSRFEDRVPDEVEPGPYVVLEVRDTGTGMDMEVLDRLFEPFFTTKELGKGTGLGLSTVYGIIRQSGGHIAVESEPGAGTTFTVYLPQVEARDAAPAAPTQADGRAPRRAGGGQRILVVEDEEAVRTLVRRVLTRAGYRVAEAASPNDAIAIANDGLESDIDLLLTDLVMPGMNGVELAEKLLDLMPGTPVVFMSGYAEGEVARGQTTHGTHHFLAKPFTPAVLVQLVDHVLRVPT